MHVTINWQKIHIQYIEINPINQFFLIFKITDISIKNWAKLWRLWFTEEKTQMIKNVKKN